MVAEYMWLAEVSAMWSLLFVIYTPLGLWRRRGAATKVVFPSLSGRLKLVSDPQSYLPCLNLPKE